LNRFHSSEKKKKKKQKMPQTTFETTPTAIGATSRHTDDYLFDPFAPPAHLTLDLAPAENLFGDSSSEHASDPSDELLYFGYVFK
jgi:hypothetical protein